MLSQKTIIFLKSWILWLSCLILFLPLFVCRQFLYPYIFGRVVIFRIIVELIFFAWLILIKYRPEYRPKWRQPILLTLTLFITILFITSITGADFPKSFWATQERMTGLLTILHLWLWTIVLASVIKSWSEWKKIIWVSLSCSILVGLYGLGQVLGIKFLLPEADASRMAATLGNPIFLGTYAMIHIFLAGFLGQIENGKKTKLLSYLVLLFNLLILILSGSRGPIVACVSTLLIFIIWKIFNIPHQEKKRIFIIFFLFLIIIVSFYAYLQTNWANHLRAHLPSFLARFLDFRNLIYGTEQRTQPWEIAWQGFKEKPILGWGWENYNIIFNKFYLPKFLRGGDEATWFDHSHNQIIDLLSISGLVGTMAYLLFYIAILYGLEQKIKNLKNDQIKTKTIYNKEALVVLILMFVAYFIQNLTVFDTPAPLIVFYFSLALVYFLTTNDESSADKLPKKNPTLKDPDFNSAPSSPIIKNNFPLPALVFLIIIFLPLTIYKFNLEPLKQSRQGLKAVNTSRVNFNSGLDLYRQALSKNTFTNPEVRLKLAQTIAEQKNKVDPRVYKSGLDFAIAELQKNTQEHPLDVRYWMYLGQLYSLGADYGANYLRQAEVALNQALILSPRRQQIYFELGRNKILQKQYEAAIAIMKKAVALDNQVAESHYNLGITYLAADKIQDGLDELDASYFPTDEHNLLYISKAFAKLDNYFRAITYCDQVLSKNPDNLDAIALKIVYLKKWGKTTEAEQILGELRIKNSGAAEQVEQFLKNNF